MLDKGKVELPDEDCQLAMYELVQEYLEAQGLHRYEISNYAVSMLSGVPFRGTAVFYKQFFHGADLHLRAAGPEVKAGQLINAKLDIVLGNDITTPVAIDEFERAGFDRVFDKEHIAIVLDHFVPNKDIKSATQSKQCREFANKCRIFSALPPQG